MNLRISEGYLRFRITREEMDILMREGRVSFVLRLGAQVTEYAVTLADSTQPLQLDAGSHSWKLLVDRAALQNFAASLPSREGMEQEMTLEGVPLTLALEVDVKRRQAA